MSWFFPGESTGARRWRRRFQIPAVIALVLGVIDILLLIFIGQRIGVLPVLLFVVAEAALGGWLIRRRWRVARQQLAEASEGRINLQQPREPVAQVVDTGLVVAGSAALIFPGLITALIGLILLVPVTRRLPAAFLNRSIGQRLPDLGDPGGLAGSRGRQRSAGYGEVIEGEVVEGDVVDDHARRGTGDSVEPTVIRGDFSDR